MNRPNDMYDMKHWKGGKIILEAIKKNVKKPSPNKKYVVWRPKKLTLLKLPLLK